MGRLVVHWACVCALVALPVGGCSDETVAMGGTGGSGATGGDGGTGGMGGAGGSGGSDATGPRTLSQRFVKDAASRNAVCNDGTDAAYYFEAGFDNGEGKWIIALQGGGQCSDPESCLDRPANRTGSGSHADTISLDGLFSSDPALNPDFFNWNAVRILYCSSDDWRGSKAAPAEPGGFHFRGHDILRAVLEDLQDADDLGTDNLAVATEVLLAGGSAGAIGVKHNLDGVAEMLSWANVGGLDDSASWSREAMGLDPAEASDYSERVAYQGLVFDESCATNEPEPDICAESMTVSLKHVATPYFIVIDQCDPLVVGAAVDQTPERKDAIAESARQLVRDHGAGFAPNIAEHSWLYDPVAHQHEVDGTSMVESLGNWYFDRAGPKVVVQDP